MTSSPHGLYAQGCKRATMAGTNRRETARWSKSEKAGPSSDWSLQLDSMKSESLVIAYQNDAVNVFLSLYTPPVKSWKLGAPEVVPLQACRR